MKFGTATHIHHEVHISVFVLVICITTTVWCTQKTIKWQYSHTSTSKFDFCFAPQMATQSLHWVVSFSVPFCLIIPVTVLLWQANNLHVSYLVASFAALLWKSPENTKLLVQTSSREHGRGLEDKVRMWPATAPPLQKRGWRGIITYCTLTQLFHNTWRQHIRSLGVFAVDRSPKLERDF